MKVIVKRFNMQQFTTKCYKNPLRLHRFNFLTVSYINVLFLHFVLHLFSTIKYIFFVCNLRIQSKVSFCLLALVRPVANRYYMTFLVHRNEIQPPGFCKNVKKRPHITERNAINGDGCYDNYNFINLRDHCTNI